MTDKISPKVQNFFLQGSSQAKAQGMVRIPPEPGSSLGEGFSSLLSKVGGVVGGVVGAATTSGIPSGIDGNYLSLINRQIEMQEQMQLVSITSNTEKSRHESKMAAIRNVRVG
jgi:hypothetical protein